VIVEAATFFRAWLRRPLGIAAILPSGVRAADACARQIDFSIDGTVLELGAGTGSLTRGLLRRGCPPGRIVAIEREAALLDLFRAGLPHIRAVHGDAARLDEILDRLGIARLAAVLSSLPIKWFPIELQRGIVNQALARLAPGGRFLQITNAYASPVPRSLLGIDGRRVGQVWLAAPPVQIWSYWR